jgi:peptidoglycan hydrolase-like protein with peptidoglycan-binding domain
MAATAIGASVGEGGANLNHDVALVQAMLHVVRDRKNCPYLGSNYDGIAGPKTKAAIVAFQTNHGLLGVKSAVTQPNAAIPASGRGAALTQHGTASPTKAGLIEPQSATLAQLVAVIPRAYAGLRSLEGQALVYLAGDPAAAAASKTAITINSDLDPDFRCLLARLVADMFQTHEIVLSIAPQGGLRTFDEQARLPSTSTKAGPGESNHNFGRAADLGFKAFRWLHGDCSIVTDDWWLGKLGSRKAAAFWTARNRLTTLYPSALAGDLIHLQAYSDYHVNMRHSLVALLNTVGQTRWENGTGAHYKSNLGLGTTLFDVGTAVSIWAREAAVTKAMIAQGRTEVQKRTPGAGTKPVSEASVTSEEVAAIKATLQNDFRLAEQQRGVWKAVA